MLKFFEPKSIAIIGASSKTEKVGGLVLRNLLDLKYKGRIYPINHKYHRIGKLKCYSSLLEIEHQIDLAVIAIPAKIVPQIVKQCANRYNKIKNIIIISAGFSEIGQPGQKLGHDILATADKNKLKIIGPNCLGIINSHRNLNASFAKNNFNKGNIALVTQSGALVTALFDLFQDENIGFSKVITLGNKLSLDETDFLKFLKNDKQTEIIALYLEDIKRGGEFLKTLKSINKPAIVLKAGNSDETKKAIQSHTGAMAGESDIAKEVIIVSGAIYVEDIEQFSSVLKLLNNFKHPKNNNILIITNAGGPGVIATDLVSNSEHLKLAKLPNKTKQDLKQLLPPSASVENPIDILGDADHLRYKNILGSITNIKNIGACLTIVTPQAGTDIKRISQVISSANKSANYPIIPVVIGDNADKIASKELNKKKINNFKYPSQIIKALDLHLISAKPTPSSANENINKARQNKTTHILSQIKKDKRKIFYFKESSALLKQYKFNVVRTNCLDEPGKFDINFPVVLKVDSPKILHKNQKQGVVLNINNAKDLKQAHIDLRNKFKGEKIIIQPQVSEGLELIMGVKYDLNFGHTLMLGLGGITTEILKIRLFFLLPTRQKIIERKLKDSKLGDIISKQNIKISKVATELYKLAALITENEKIKELDINPIIFYKNQPPVIVDIKILL